MTTRTFHQVAVALCVVLGLTVLARAEDAYPQEVVVTPVLKAGKDAAGQKIEYPSGAPAEVTGVVVEIPPGKQTGWHVHLSPCFAYVMEGEVTVEWADGSKRVVKAGEAFAEVVDLKHNGSNQGSVPAKLIMFVIGTKDAPIAVKTI